MNARLWSKDNNKIWNIKFGRISIQLLSSQSPFTWKMWPWWLIDNIWLHFWQARNLRWTWIPQWIVPPSKAHMRTWLQACRASLYSRWPVNHWWYIETPGNPPSRSTAEIQLSSRFSTFFIRYTKSELLLARGHNRNSNPGQPAAHQGLDRSWADACEREGRNVIDVDGQRIVNTGIRQLGYGVSVFQCTTNQ